MVQPLAPVAISASLDRNVLLLLSVMIPMEEIIRLERAMFIFMIATALGVGMLLILTEEALGSLLVVFRRKLVLEKE